MKNFIIVVGTLVVFILLLRYFTKRLRLLTSLKKAAKRADAKLRLMSPMFWLPTNRGKRCALLVIGPDAVYSIKVIGLFQKYCDLHFWNSREYSTRKYLFHWQIEQSNPLGSSNFRHKPLDVDFKADLLEYLGCKQHVCFYLLYPTNSPIKITKNNGNSIVDLEVGDKIDDVIFADREYLFQYIALALHQRADTSKKTY